MSDDILSVWKAIINNVLSSFLFSREMHDQKTEKQTWQIAGLTATPNAHLDKLGTSKIKAACRVAIKRSLPSHCGQLQSMDGDIGGPGALTDRMLGSPWPPKLSSSRGRDSHRQTHFWKILSRKGLTYLNKFRMRKACSSHLTAFEALPWTLAYLALCNRQHSLSNLVEKECLRKVKWQAEGLWEG